MTSTSPLVAGRYRLVGELGRGGMGVVWEAFDEVLHRAVAVKEVRFPPELPEAERAQLAGRTLREARAVAAVDTPAAVRVFDIVEQDSRPWLVMELLRGTTLSAEIASRGGLPEPEVVRIGLALVDALEVAHEAGVLHRDVKPSNVLLGADGRVALTDFGIATIEGDTGEATTGVVLGSPSYVAPERVAGDRPTAASDYWALGATLWTALEGRPPYEGPTAFAVMTAVTHGEAPPCTRCSPAVQQLLASLLARDPAQRPAPATVRAVLERSAAEPAAAPSPTVTLPLEEHFDRTTVLAPPPREPRPAVTPRVRPVASPGRRNRLPAVLGLAALVVLLAGGLGLVLAGRDAGPGGAVSPPSPQESAAPTASAAPSSSGAGSPATASGQLVRARGDGWSLQVPAGWERSSTSAGTRYTDPAGGRYLLVATRDPAGPSAVGAWRDQERSFRAAHAGYERIRLETIAEQQASDAADWEFRYTDGGAQLHALDRAWVVDGVGYAVFVQSREGQWTASRALFDQVLASFRATGD